MQRFATIFTAALLLSFLSTPVNATSNEYVVLESITAVNSTVTLGENLEYELVVSSPITFEWDPRDSNWDGYLRLLLCKPDLVEPDSIPENCLYQNLQSRYLLTTIDNISENIIFDRKQIRFTVYGKPINYGLGEFFVYMVRIPNANQNDPDETHVYYINRSSALDMFGTSKNIEIPSFEQTLITVREEVEEQQEVEIQQEVEESVPEQIPTLAPQPSSGSSNNKSVTVIATPAIQSNFMLPAIKGDQNWRPLKGIKGNFENWKVAKKNSLEGVPVRFTKTNGSMITFTTAGEAVSVRYLAGKKRGSFSIFVNGKFLERIDTNKKKKQSLVKTWNNLGEGKHYVDIVAELENGQSLAISGVQKLKD